MLFCCRKERIKHMIYCDTLMTNLTDAAVQQAFRAYYGELGVHVTNWEGLFAEISSSPDCLFVRRTPDGGVIGFLLFSVMEAATAGKGFFTARLGCVEEFWIAAEYRGQGHGTALLQLVEKHFAQLGCAYVILTTDTAPAFYRRHGYTHQCGIRAKNNAPVYVKKLSA